MKHPIPKNVFPFGAFSVDKQDPYGTSTIKKGRDMKGLTFNRRKNDRDTSQANNLRVKGRV